MNRIARHKLQWPVGLTGLAMAVVTTLLAGQLLGWPRPSLLAAGAVAILLLAAGQVALWRLGLHIDRQGADVAAALQMAIEQASGTPVPDDTGLEPEIGDPRVRKGLAAVVEQLGSLARQRDQHKLAARLAQKHHRQVEAILNCLPDALVVTDAMDRVVLANQAADRMLQISLPQGAAVPLSQSIREREIGETLRGAFALPAAKETECTLDGPDGRRIVRVKIAPFGDDRPDQGAVAVLHDVTREHTASRMKTEFVANASHELRTPLGGIKAYLEMLTDGEVRDDQTRDRFYQVMQGEVDRLSTLVDNILNIARIEAGIVKVAKDNVPLTALVQEVVETLSPQARTLGIQLTSDLLPVFFHVYADREMLRRAVTNLVSNALKYTPQGGSVAVRMHVDEAAGQVSVDVSDTGVGISEQDLPRLFQKFFRVESSKKMAKGTGLGLVLVKEVVESLHGGHVSATSTQGKGSTFSIRLPLVQDKQGAGHGENTGG